MTFTRRELGKLLLTVPAASLVGRDVFGRTLFQTKPDSKWAGVEVGLHVPYTYGARTMPVDDVIQTTVQLGVSAVDGVAEALKRPLAEDLLSSDATRALAAARPVQVQRPQEPWRALRQRDLEWS